MLRGAGGLGAGGGAAHILSHGLAPGTPRTMAIDIAPQSFNLILGFGLSIPVFFVTTNAWILWIVVPLVVSRWRHAHRRRRNREAEDSAPG